jgi:hypothetical protein
MSQTASPAAAGISPTPAAWLVLAGGLWKLPLPLLHGWWDALLESATADEASVPLRDWGQRPHLTPVALLRRHLRGWSGDVAGLAPLLEGTLTPRIVILAVEQLYQEGLFLRREATKLEEWLFPHISADGRWL